MGTQVLTLPPCPICRNADDLEVAWINSYDYGIDCPKCRFQLSLDVGTFDDEDDRQREEAARRIIDGWKRNDFRGLDWYALPPHRGKLDTPYGVLDISIAESIAQVWRHDRRQWRHWLRKGIVREWAGELNNREAYLYERMDGTFTEPMNHPMPAYGWPERIYGFFGLGRR